MGQDSETLSQAAHHGGLEMAVGSTRSFLPPILGQFWDPEEDQVGPHCPAGPGAGVGGQWERVAESRLWAQVWLGRARRPPRGWGSLCQALADLLRSLQLISCALPHILLRFWPAWQSLHPHPHPHLLWRWQGGEGSFKEGGRVSVGIWGLMGHSAVTLWPGHKPRPGALGGFGFMWQSCVRRGLWRQIWVCAPAPLLTSCVTWGIITHSLDRDEDPMRGPK